MKKLTYRLFTVVIFVPYLACNVVRMAAEGMDGWIIRMRRWAFPDKFARIPRNDR